MANKRHLELILQGNGVWNIWRSEHSEEQPDLSGADLSRFEFLGFNLRGTNFEGSILHSANFEGVDFTGTNFLNADLTGSRIFSFRCFEPVFGGANLSDVKFIKIDFSMINLGGAKLSGASFSHAYGLSMLPKNIDLSGTKFYRCNFNGSDLKGFSFVEVEFSQCHFYQTNLSGINFTKAKFNNCYLNEANLIGVNLSEAILSSTDLNGAILVKANVEQSVFASCFVHNIIARNLIGKPKEPLWLVIFPSNSTSNPIIVDDLQIAQIISLLFVSDFGKMINAITSTVVLIIGRFTPERKDILDAMAAELKKYDLLPVIFDFERPDNRDFTETIRILTGMSVFVIADITNPSSSPLELQAAIPEYQIPFVPILQEGEQPFSMFRDLRKYEWVLQPLFTYSSKENLLNNFKAAIIDRAWEKRKELQKKKTADMQIQSIDDFIRNKS